MNELQILEELDHPDIIRLHEWFEDDNNFYLVTEYSGNDLVFVKEASSLIIWKRNVTCQKIKPVLFLVKC